MKKILSISSLILLVLIFGLVIFFTKSKDISNSRLDEIKKSGKIVMGCNANYPPFEFHKNIDGKDEILGLDVFIGKEIAKDLGVELEISDMEFSSVLASLDTGVIDLAISGVSKTPEREKSMAFSEVYYEPKNYLLVNKENLG
ncbi:MAG: transporter substrate-binding domain-containing protein, partial [Peptoniphilus harei]|nr:transporter substrate-binding domain-containing protein [Peptoniphilus harei]